MTTKTKKSLVVINVFIIFLMLCLFGVGYFAVHKSNAELNSDAVDYDAKLRSRIGKLYTSKEHNSAVEYLDSGDEQNKSIIKVLNSLSKVTFQIGGVSAFLLILNTFLLIKHGGKNQAEQVVAPDA